MDFSIYSFSNEPDMGSDPVVKEHVHAQESAVFPYPAG